MANNSTNPNKMYNHLSPKTIEHTHKKKTKKKEKRPGHNDDEHLSSGLGQHKDVAGYIPG